MHDPKTQHMSALKCIIWYIHDTLDFGLHLYPSYVCKLVYYTHVIGMVVQTPNDSSLTIVFILVTIISHGLPNANTHFLGHV